MVTTKFENQRCDKSVYINTLIYIGNQLVQNYYNMKISALQRRHLKEVNILLQYRDTIANFDTGTRHKTLIPRLYISNLLCLTWGVRVLMFYNDMIER